ncbi:hypothetical protein KIH39_08660 [Telmatocola sphagniphila]|uniref:Uncharacterized protein n=1 Tax=Telmatocola sphagniphila TaxID=1123043 RepID=A0A8E6BB82_9BACT|nr:hypothetical protein [Telmatocola sphagniphila]QVL33963.1 hypothetical protein KIH39_08660 [Telmatocola sphagniphila]
MQPSQQLKRSRLENLPEEKNIFCSSGSVKRPALRRSALMGVIVEKKQAVSLAFKYPWWEWQKALESSEKTDRMQNSASLNLLYSDFIEDSEPSSVKEA